ncbi:MAG: START domain-containing protein [Candidatus Omnitrophica bacterium]|nr:START domain-containing protein [Candidatus Omnitrophota bacterium]
MKKLCAVFLASSVLLSGFNAFGAEYPWALKLRQDGVSVYTRKVPGSDILEFKSDVIVNAPIKKVTAFFEDAREVPKWSYQCRRMRLVQDERPQSKVFYYVIHLPWPVTQRDCVFRRIKSVDPATGVVTYGLTGLPQRLPQKRGNVRVTYLKTIWRFTPLKDGRTGVYYQQFSNPGGSLPPFLANALVVEIPYNSLKNFRTLVQK